jgi:hypothetical protein
MSPQFVGLLVGDSMEDWPVLGIRLLLILRPSSLILRPSRSLEIERSLEARETRLPSSLPAVLLLPSLEAARLQPCRVAVLRLPRPGVALVVTSACPSTR